MTSKSVHPIWPDQKMTHPLPTKIVPNDGGVGDKAFWEFCPPFVFVLTYMQPMVDWVLLRKVGYFFSRKTWEATSLNNNNNNNNNNNDFILASMYLA